MNPRAVADLSHFECDPFTTWVLLRVYVYLIAALKNLSEIEQTFRADIANI